MSSDPSTPVLLRRLAALEASVGRLSQDVGSLRSVILGNQSIEAKQRGAASSRRPAAGSDATDAGRGRRDKGLTGASARGEAARVQWVREGLVTPGEQLTRAWGLTRQALAAAADRREAFSVKVGNRLYYPQAFLTLERDAVAKVCRALGDLTSTEKLMFWLRHHGSLAGHDVAGALEAGVPLARIERLAGAWARERGAARVAAAA